MRLKILGCSGGIGPGLRTSAYLLDDRVLVDAGTGVGEIPCDRMCKIHDILLTHSHLDHVVALPLLVDTIFSCLEPPLRVHSQAETIDVLKEHIFNWRIWPDFAELPKPREPVLAFEAHSPGAPFDVTGYRVEMFDVDHVVPGVAYVIERDGRSFCFSGDTTSNDTLWTGLNAREQLDVLLVECAFPDDREELARMAKHYCPKLLAADLKKLTHRPRIVITHLRAGYEEETMAQLRAHIGDRDLIQAKHGLVLEI